MSTSKAVDVDPETGEVLDTGPEDDGGFEAGMTEMSDIAIEDQTEAEMAEIEEEMETEHAVAQASHNVGMKLLSAFIDELSAAGVRRNDDTEFILERLTRRIKSELRSGYLQIMAREVPVVIATMGKVVLGGEKIQAAVSIDKHIDAKNRHALADFAGSDVLIVMADDIESHLADMDDLAHEAAQVQTELDLVQPLTDHMEGVVEQIAAAEAELEDEALDTSGEKVEETNIDPSRLIVEGGKVVGVAPDPECEMCAGAGGWDQTVQDPDDENITVDEWVRCECVELPE